MAHEGDQLVGVRAQQLEVLGRDGVGDGDGDFAVVDEHAHSRLVQRRLDVGAARGFGGDSGDLGLDGVGDGLVPGDEPGETVGPVLGLDDDVDGGVGGRDRRVGDHDDLRRSGERRGHTDPALARHLTLGDGDVDVAGTDDDVDGRDRLGPVGEGGDGLGAADRVDGVGAGDGGGREHDVGRPDRRGRAGRRRATWATPATRAGITVMSTVDGYTARPPGT